MKKAFLFILFVLSGCSSYDIHFQSVSDLKAIKKEEKTIYVKSDNTIDNVRFSGKIENVLRRNGWKIEKPEKAKYVFIFNIGSPIVLQNPNARSFGILNKRSSSYQENGNKVYLDEFYSIYDHSPIFYASIFENEQNLMKAKEVFSSKLDTGPYIRRASIEMMAEKIYAKFLQEGDVTKYYKCNLVETVQQENLVKDYVVCSEYKDVFLPIDTETIISIKE